MKHYLYPLLISFLFTLNLYSQEIRWADKLIDYTSELSRKECSAKEILGKPSVMPEFGFSECSWCPHPVFGRDYESITVGFDNPIFVEQIIINENYYSGLIYQIILFDSLNIQNIVYENKYPKLNSNSNLFRTLIQKTQYRVYKLQLKVLASLAYKGCGYDAIGISDAATPINIQINSAISKDINYLPENLGPNINSESPELAPIITQDGQKIYFTRSDHPLNIGIKKAQDIWYSNLNSKNEFMPAINIGYPLNNEYSNYAISVSADGNSMIVGNKYNSAIGKASPGISISYLKGTDWSYPQGLEILELNPMQSSSSYNLASNGKVLILSVEREDSFGKNDMYVSFKINDSTWSEPQNLGLDINSATDDVAPFIAADMTTLFFSSSGRPGYGDKDIFISRRLDDTWKHWSEPLNIGSPINTSEWDAYFTIPASGEYGYFVSSNNSIGREDIFRIKLPEALKPQIVTLVSGRVLNAKDNTPVDAKIIYEFLNSGQEAGLARSNANDGSYQIVLPAGNKYGFLAEANGFIAINENLDLKNITYYQEINKDLYLVPVKKGATIRLNNIFFEFAKFELLTDSYSELNRIITFLNENNEYNIEISGHTDNVGSDANNKQLSKNRANAVAQYLISKGIVKNRIKIVGYGKSKPVAPNDTDENRQINRRVEFKLL